METKILYSDSIALFLFYRYLCNGNTNISYEKLLDYEKIIQENLSGVSIIPRKQQNEKRTQFFSFVSRENGEFYACLKKDAHTLEDMYEHINELPIELFIASQMENALQFVGIKLDNGNFYPLENSEATFARKKQRIPKY